MIYCELSKTLKRNPGAIYQKAVRMDLEKDSAKKLKVDSLERELEFESRRKMHEFKLNLKKGKKISLAIKENNRVLRKIKGQVVGKNKNFITLQALNYKESFLVSDFYSGVSQILG
ncbi:hypothetical protein G8S49_01355 [Clostridium botulinum C]|uniref:Uncharacterized protein n=3 Tax=Clostridium botulinum TaxID=1491 RepID=A0A6G4D7A3_CLOBO|nr:hypothetical protein [Clostridium botulinum]EGO87962.1 hypothetical protein CBCST_08419 [Clostridium botulinum C str. Stockholm]MCD3194223.1 hypothetical protein [Clostridium botulinum C]MCD3199148.1 hypothetical protein [Clostridium botulinum C]MCD3204623.1 hypothetical protein [Clostridium botulinum C]MCD3207966.1 hypothetical protein [Clostridium botulinum C]